jgi:predicted negative regulator of RcsB-dependent stress response
VKEWAKNNVQYIVSTVLIPLGIWLGSKVLEGEHQKGYNEGKQEVEQTADKALHDAIVYRLKYEHCCAKETD